LPIGLVYAAAGAVVLDPDRQIEHTVRLVFNTFREVSSASATVRRFAREGLKFPHRVQSGSARGEVLWEGLEHARVLQICITRDTTPARSSSAARAANGPPT
jgi:hypothetical protein